MGIAPTLCLSQIHRYIIHEVFDLLRQVNQHLHVSLRKKSTYLRQIHAYALPEEALNVTARRSDAILVTKANVTTIALSHFVIL